MGLGQNLNLCWVLNRAVGAGTAGPAAAGPIFGQLTPAKMPYMSFGGLFSCCSKSSDSGRSKLSSKTAGTSRYQNPNIYTPEESSQWALSNDHRWSLRTPLMRKLLAFLIFPIQTSIERKLKTAGTRADSLGRYTIFCKEQPLVHRLMCVGRS